MALRPYSRSGIPSVTQVINCFSIEDKAMAMSYSAANITAESGDRKEFRTRWDKKRLLGTQVHAMAVQWAMGEHVDSTPEADPYMDGLDAFYDQYHPEWVHLEQCVGYDVRPRRYVGSFDAIASLRCPVCCSSTKQFWTECRWLIDIKTTGKGPDVHLIDWTLQLAAYRFANRLTKWEKGTELPLMSMPPVRHTGILWLKDDGSAELVNVPTTGASFTAFLQLLDIFVWAQDLKKGTNAVQSETKDRSATRTSKRPKRGVLGVDGTEGTPGLWTTGEALRSSSSS